MVDDSQARHAVRQLMERLDTMNAQHLALAYVLAERDKDAYAGLLEAAERAEDSVIRPLMDEDLARSRFYRALQDPDANWCEALVQMLEQGPTILGENRLA